MHDNRLLTEARLDRFIRERLEPAVYRCSSPLHVTAWHAPGEPVPFAHAVDQTYEPMTVGTAWGRPWSTSWLHVTGAVPAQWLDGAGNLPVGTQAELVIDLGFNRTQTGFQCEALVYDLQGHPLKAVSPLNSYVRSAVAADGQVDVLVEAAANPDLGSDWSFAPTALGDPETAGVDPIYVLTQVDVALLDLPVWELAQDVRVLRGLMLELPLDQPRRAEILRALELMLDAVDPHDVSTTAPAGRALLRRVLDQPAHASAHKLHAMGHAHIDSAWLWPIRETIRKCARTFSNMVSLMDEDPTFTFACSSAQQFAWMKEFYPSLWERIRAKVAEGRFVPVGGMWVESDTNMPGSEAMARQFIAGKGFFIDEFGIECEEVWLPDSFGYSGALPQIVAAAGSRWFLTQKISWNETNKMPHHSFLWEGIDGTRVFTHFPPVDKYNSDLNGEDLAHAERNYAEKGSGTMSLLPYGYGDGGGGSTREMQATVARTNSLEGSPRVLPSTPRMFFTAAEAEYASPPVWAGELYLEAQRGTYTSQLATKQGNRRSEHLLREAELWATTAAVRTGCSYPYDELRDIWQNVLLQQFHDILPGSSIAWVHRDAHRNYTQLAVRLERIIAEQVRELVGVGEHSVVLNAAPHGHDAVPALGGAVESATEYVPAQASGGGYQLANAQLKVRIDERGLITELYDIAAARDLVPPGEVANLFQLHRDTPTRWDAWDIDFHYRNTVEDLTECAISVGPDGSTVRIERRFGKSQLVQTIRLRADSRWLDIDLEVDWHEQQKLLKLGFALDVHADHFSSEIQFGHIKRPTHTNTSWDSARFETCAHRWVHVGEPGYGVALLNDSSYGFDVTRRAGLTGGVFTVARVSVVRGALYPDPQQDQGLHRLSFALLVGAEIQDAVAGGYQLNLGHRTIHGAGTDRITPLLTVSNPGVVIEAVKLAEDRSGDVVVRLYEALGRRATATVSADFASDVVLTTDLLERGTDEPHTVAELNNPSSVALTLRPFQIVTLRYRTVRAQ